MSTPGAPSQGQSDLLQEPQAGSVAACAMDTNAAGALQKDLGLIRSGRLAGLTMWGAIFALSWPILIESFLTSLVGLVDTTLSAGLSEAATDAIGAAAYVLWFVQMIGMSVGVGATALVSRSIGKGRRAVADAVTAQALLLALGASILVALALIALAPVIAQTLQLSPDASRELVLYLRVTALAVPLSGVLVAGIACCRGAGDAKRPLVVMIVVNLVNIFVSWSLSGVDLARAVSDGAGGVTRSVILPNPFSFDLGILGVALGTVAAWAIGAAIIIWWLWRGSPGVRLRARRLRPDPKTFSRVARVGAPNFFESTGMWLGNFLVILIVGWMAAGREGLLGAHIIAIRIESFSFLPGFSMGMAAATLAGQYLGAGRADLASTAMIRCTGIAVVIMGLMGMLFILAPRPIVGLLSQQATHLEYAPHLLMVAGSVQAPFAIGLVLRTAMRGAGDTKVVMWLTWISTYAIRLPAAWFFSGVDIPLWDGMVIPNPGPDWGLVGIWIGLCGELIVRALLFGGRFVQGGWRHIRV